MPLVAVLCCYSLLTAKFEKRKLHDKGNAHALCTVVVCLHWCCALHPLTPMVTFFCLIAGGKSLVAEILVCRQLLIQQLPAWSTHRVMIIFNIVLALVVCIII